MTLYQQWLDAKETERQATNARRKIEDGIRILLDVPADLESTSTFEKDGYVIKIAGRIDLKVDSEKLQELAAESGLLDHLSSLFRWKPEINSAAWKAADESITKPLLGAITSKPGRPSFTITKE